MHARTRPIDPDEEEKDPVIRVYLRGVDRTLLGRNLSRSVDERFLQLLELQRFAAELRRAGEQARSR